MMPPTERRGETAEVNAIAVHMTGLRVATESELQWITVILYLVQPIDN